VLSDCSKRLFTFLDVKIRGAVKRSLKMAKNTSNFFIHSLVNEGDLMATAVRMARGRPERDVACDACDRTESIGHILQLCPRTNGARNDRHNSVLDRTVKVLVKNHWSILVKAAIPTPAGFRRPDIVAWKGGKACYII
jgi:hypothetical protein